MWSREMRGQHIKLIPTPSKRSMEERPQKRNRRTCQSNFSRTATDGARQMVAPERLDTTASGPLYLALSVGVPVDTQTYSEQVAPAGFFLCTSWTRSPPADRPPSHFFLTDKLWILGSLALVLTCASETLQDCTSMARSFGDTTRFQNLTEKRRSNGPRSCGRNAHAHSVARVAEIACLPT